MLVVIGILGLLIAISVPALRGARAAARQVVCLSNLRGVGMTFEHYTQANRSAYPFAPAGTPIPTSPEGGDSIIHDHWQPRSHWPGLVRDVAPWREHYPTWLCPGALRDPNEPWLPGDSDLGQGFPSYRYSTSFMARPQLWAPDAAADPDLLKPVYTHDVRHPSAKALMWDWEMAHLAQPATHQTPRPMLFPDGHASLRRISDATTPGRNPFRDTSTPIDDTVWGVQGNDY